MRNNLSIKKNIKILIIGFGSIGQRHYRNLLGLGYKNVYVYDVNGERIRSQELRIKSLDQSSLKDFNVVFVCSPNNLHVRHALLAVKAGCYLFIEKPLSHNMRGIEKLREICEEKKIITMIGCNMRFHPCLKFIKNYLDKNKLGKIYGLDHECGYYLPYWRPGTDYRKNYAAKKETGGGIILDDIHEFDLMFWLNNFIKVAESKFIFGRVGNLEIETEDICIAGFKFRNKVLGTIRCDYLQQSYSRNCKVKGEKGNIEWDFKENIVWLKTKEKNKKLFSVKDFDFNRVYVDEVKYFFDCIRKNKKTFNDINVATNVLKYCYEK